MDKAGGGRASTPKACFNEHDVLGPGPEAAESQLNWNSCTKNRGHETFIPIDDFKMEHLPEPWRKKDFFEMAKVCSVLTGRIRVSSTSSARPDDGGIYSLENGGPRTGTCFIPFIDDIVGECPCKTCKGQSERKKEFWKFRISTAMHVVYDGYEVEKTFVDVLFDNHEDAREGGKMRTLRGFEMVETNKDKDCSIFTCITHDEVFVAYMKGEVERGRKLWEESLRMWRGALSPRPVIIFSHPHGFPKRVTIGEERDQDGDHYSYTTDTCPGCSGAIAYGWSRSKKDWKSDGVVHGQGGEPDKFNNGYYNVVNSNTFG